MAPIPVPRVRQLRGYAIDPSLGTALLTMQVNELTYQVPWEDLQPRDDNVAHSYPVGEYIAIVDHDPATGVFYEPVNLDHPHLLAANGLAPSVSNPQFHQQFVYAVIMTTIKNFEKALGRKVLWAEDILVSDPPPGSKSTRKRYDFRFVRRLRVYPHALRQANAFYDPARKALLFGYFESRPAHAGLQLPGSVVFTCLSHDIIAHETTHAILDGIHRRYIDPTDPDTRAFHESFADIVALFQHFSFPEVLRHQVAQTRGDLKKQNLLGQLALQFGQAIGGYGSLRDAIGHFDANNTWVPHKPGPEEYHTKFEVHDRGAILVAAIFEAFLNIYEARSRKILRIATGGTGRLPDGDLHPDLVDELAKIAATCAGDVLRLCIRALDYCPPSDLTFGDYLRAIVTADFDMVADDKYGYRVAFIEAFQKRGIAPDGVRSMAVEDLLHRLHPLETSTTDVKPFAAFLRELRNTVGYINNREEAYEATNRLIRQKVPGEADDDDYLSKSILEILVKDGGAEDPIRLQGLLLKLIRLSNDRLQQELHQLLSKECSGKETSKRLYKKLQSLLGLNPDGLHKKLLDHLVKNDGAFAKLTGLMFPPTQKEAEALGLEWGYLSSGQASYAVGNVSLANRTTPDGGIANHVIITLAQKRGVRFKVDDNDISVDEMRFFVPDHTPQDQWGDDAIMFRGGCTLVFDLDTLRLRYIVKKDIDDRARMVRQYRCEKGLLGGPANETYFAGNALAALAGPFAFTHSHAH